MKAAGIWRCSLIPREIIPRSIASLKTCVARQPTNGTAWAVLGLAEFETKDYGNARIHLERGQALGLSGSAASVQLATYRLAILLNQNGEFERATELLISERATSSDAQEIQFALGISLLRIPLLPWQVGDIEDQSDSSRGRNCPSAAGKQI